MPSHLHDSRHHLRPSFRVPINTLLESSISFMGPIAHRILPHWASESQNIAPLVIQIPYSVFQLSDTICRPSLEVSRKSIQIYQISTKGLTVKHAAMRARRIGAFLFTSIGRIKTHFRSQMTYGMFLYKVPSTKTPKNSSLRAFQTSLCAKRSTTISSVGRDQ